MKSQIERAVQAFSQMRVNCKCGMDTPEQMEQIVKGFENKRLTYRELVG